MFGLTGGHALNVLHDLDHTARVDKFIQILLDYVKQGYDIDDDDIHCACHKAGMTLEDLTEDDIVYVYAAVGRHVPRL